MNFSLLTMVYAILPMLFSKWLLFSACLVLNDVQEKEENFTGNQGNVR